VCQAIAGRRGLPFASTGVSTPAQEAFFVDLGSRGLAASLLDLRPAELQDVGCFRWIDIENAGPRSQERRHIPRPNPVPEMTVPLERWWIKAGPLCSASPGAPRTAGVGGASLGHRLLRESLTIETVMLPQAKVLACPRAFSPECWLWKPEPLQPGNRFSPRDLPVETPRRKPYFP